MRPLNRSEKRNVCMLARRAWVDSGARAEWLGSQLELLPGEEPVSESALFRAWRMKEQQAAAGAASLTLCTVGDYPALMLRFAELAGDDLLASRWVVRTLEDARGRALHVLRKSCLDRGLAYPEYPTAICRAQYKCGLAAATEKQLWRLVYTVRNRRKVLKQNHGTHGRHGNQSSETKGAKR